jgi:hypothetical protein
MQEEAKEIKKRVVKIVSRKKLAEVVEVVPVVPVVEVVPVVPVVEEKKQKRTVSRLDKEPKLKYEERVKILDEKYPLIAGIENEEFKKLVYSKLSVK